MGFAGRTPKKRRGGGPIGTARQVNWSKKVQSNPNSNKIKTVEGCNFSCKAVRWAGGTRRLVGGPKDFYTDFASGGQRLTRKPNGILTV